MDQSLLVQIYTPTFGKDGFDAGGREGRTGTGFPVGHGLVLTALHVVRPADRDLRYPISVLWTADPEPQWRDLEADPIAWSGERSGLDAALVRCACPFDAPWLGIVSAEPPGDRAPWVSAGFPNVGKTIDTRRWHGFMGRMYALASTEKTFELDVTGARPREELDWQGASGMPVCLPNSNMILGVVVSFPKRFTGDRLNATPTALMHKDEDFQRALGLSDHRDDTLRRFRDRLARVLRRSTTAVERLATVMAAPAGSRNINWLMDRFLASTFSQAMDALWAAFRPLDDDRDIATEDELKALNTLELAAQTVGPVLFDAGLIGGLRTQMLDPNVKICRLYSSVPTVAELVMAGADGWHAEYHPRRGTADAPFGKRNLAFLPPEGGIGSEPDRGRQLRLDLARKLAPGEWREIRQRLNVHMVAELVPGTLQDDTDSNIERASDILTQLSTGGRGFYMLCALPTEDRARQEVEEGLRQTKKDYPALVIVALDDTASADEERMRSRTAEMKRINAFRLMIPMERRPT
jgi:hypothetical protein